MVVAVLDMVSHLDHVLNVMLELLQQVEQTPAKVVMVENGQMQDQEVVQVSFILIFSH